MVQHTGILTMAD